MSGAPRKGTNLPAMGDFNESVILEAIRRSPDGRSRVELAADTGLSPQTVSNIARRLLERDLIVEADRRPSGPGKPRTPLRLNRNGRFAIGVHLDPTVMTLVILDLSGSVVARVRKPTPPMTEPDTVLRQISHAIDALIDASGIPRSRLGGIGIAAPGPIDRERGIVVDPPHFVGWDRVPLREALAKATGLPAVLDKDVAAAALAELWAGSGGTSAGAAESFLFMYLGTGIGSGIVVRGELLHGVSENAGEIGHIVTDPDGPPCTCGQRGCVAVTCMPKNLIDEATRVGVFDSEAAERAGNSIEDQFRSLCKVAAGGNLQAQRIIEQSATRMSRAVAVIANLLDVNRVVFGGPFWAPVADTYLRIVPRDLEQLRAARSIHHVEVAATSVGDDVAAIGAACLVLDRDLTPHPSTLMLAG